MAESRKHEAAEAEAAPRRRGRPRQVPIEEQHIPNLHLQVDLVGHPIGVTPVDREPPEPVLVDALDLALAVKALRKGVVGRFSRPG